MRIVLVIFLWFSPLATLCAKAADPESSQTEIRLAVVAPLTGNWGKCGTDIVRGAQLAIDYLAPTLGPVRLVLEDACLPADTVRAAHKLLDVDNIHAIVGSYCVVGMVPMATLTEKKQVIAIHTSAVADAILDSGDYTFTTNISIRDEARQLAEYAYNQLGLRRAAVLYLLTQWGQDYQKYFVERFKALGGNIVASFENPIGTTDFRTELTKVKSAQPDVIFMAHVAAELGIAMKQARQLGLEKQVILGAHEVEEPTVIEIAGKAAEGLRFLSPQLPNSGETVVKFREDYLKRHGTYPGILAANAFDATSLTIKFERECKLEPQCVKQKFYGLKDFEGASGRFSITPEGGTVKNFVHKILKDGKFQLE